MADEAAFPALEERRADSPMREGRGDADPAPVAAPTLTANSHRVGETDPVGGREVNGATTDAAAMVEAAATSAAEVARGSGSSTLAAEGPPPTGAEAALSTPTAADLQSVRRSGPPAALPAPSSPPSADASISGIDAALAKAEAAADPPLQLHCPPNSLQPSSPRIGRILSSTSATASPDTITLLGVGKDLRRKRIKKVSHYILGPLLGEGVYGVVRDCIDITPDTMTRQLTRRAIKTVNGNFGLGSGGNVAAAEKDSAAAATMRGGEPSSNGEGVMLATSPLAIASHGDSGSAQRGLRRTKGNGDVDAKAQMIFEREMRNLQRFHSKNIIRALDSFSRYGKEYVVMPIAICSIQQLVRQLLRTRWRELQRSCRQDGTAAYQLHHSGSCDELAIMDLTFDDNLDDDSSSCYSHREEQPNLRGDFQGSASKQVKSSPLQRTKKGNAATQPSSLPLSLLRHQQHRRRSSSHGSSSSSSSSDADGDSSTSSTTRTIDSYYPSYQPRHRRRGGGTTATESDDGSRRTASGYDIMSATPPVLSEQPGLGVLDLRTSRDSSLATLLDTSGQKAKQAPLLIPPPICSPTLLKGIFYQLICGVNYLHSQNVGHNDIKPSNVLLFEDGTVKLADLGSVQETYSDQGTPLFASPELSRYFYGAETPPPAFAANSDDLIRAVVKTNDMWCCGLFLYYLLTGRPGPLAVQQRYAKYLHQQQHPNHDCRATAHIDGAVPQNRYQLYREIASQVEVVNLDDIPDLIAPDMYGGDGDGAGGVTATTAADYAEKSVRHLLRRLLELDPMRRITAAEALQHPWLCMVFRPKGSSSSGANGSTAAGGQHRSNGGADVAQRSAVKLPSKQAMEEAIQRDVARRVMQSRHVRKMIDIDRQRHLQFTADCCNTLGIALPPEIIHQSRAEPYAADREEVFSAIQGNGSDVGVVVGRVLSSHWPAVMPPGCVDVSLFLPSTEEHYYQQKSGMMEFDVCSLRDDAATVRRMAAYLYNAVLIQCGYRTAPDPAYASRSAAGTSAGLSAAEEEERHRLRRRGASGVAQQPFITIRAGSSNSSLTVAAVRGGIAGASLASTIEGSGQDGSGPGLRYHSRVATPPTTAGRRFNDHQDTDTTAGPPSALPPLSAAVMGAVIGMPVADNNHESAGQRRSPRSSPTVNRSGAYPVGRGVVAEGRQSGTRASGRNESMSSNEANVAMKESSKCLCGLM